MKSKAPEGYSAVSPLLHVQGIAQELEFLKEAFGAETITHVRDENGDVIYGEARIGDSIVMLDLGRGEQVATQSRIYIWTDDIDKAYQRALKSGAAPVEEPADQPYGIREARVRDPEGNTWWLGQETQKLTTSEVERRLAEQRKSRL